MKVCLGLGPKTIGFGQVGDWGVTRLRHLSSPSQFELTGTWPIYKSMIPWPHGSTILCTCKAVKTLKPLS